MYANSHLYALQPVLDGGTPTDAVQIEDARHLINHLRARRLREVEELTGVTHNLDDSCRRDKL